MLIDRYEALDSIIEAAIEQPDRRVLVDLAAQTHDPLVKWMDESGVLEMAGESGFEITYWHVMDSGRDSVDLLKKLLDRFGARLGYVLVRNQMRGDDFSLLERSGEQDRAEALGARTVSIKHLSDAIIQKIDGSSSSFWAAQHDTEKSRTGLGMMDRQRLKMWLRDAHQQIESAGV